MQSTLRTISCPDCGSREPQFGDFCYTCYGTRRIVLTEAKRPLEWKRLWQVGLVCFGLALLGLIALHRGLASALRSIGW